MYCDWCEKERKKLSVFVDVHGKTVNICDDCQLDMTVCSQCGRVENPDWFNESFRITDDGEVVCWNCILKPIGVKKVYHRTDAWRGHWALEPIQKNVAIAVECCIVPHEQNDDMLQITEYWLENMGFTVHHFALGTSNVFSRNLNIVVKKDRLTENDKEALRKIDKVFVEYYRRGFSILAGRTYPIDINQYEKELEKIAYDHYPEVVTE